MPTRTVNQGFTDFLQRLTPTPGESTAAKKHRAFIKDCLERNFNMTRFFKQVLLEMERAFPDIVMSNYFAEIPPSNLKVNSTTTLNQVRDVLKIRFPRTKVRVSCPAVVIPLGIDAKESTDSAQKKLRAASQSLLGDNSF